MNSQFAAIRYGLPAFIGPVTPKADRIQDLIACLLAHGEVRSAMHR